MKSLLVIGTVIAAVRCRQYSKRRRTPHMHFELWNGIPPEAMAYNRMARSEYTFDRERFERLNRIIHGGEE